MAMTPDDVLKLIKDKEVKFVDLRFTDTRGKEQHVTVPVKYFNKEKFEHGHAFDGSSIAGWKGIQASDMLLMPDPDTARMDPFTDEPVLNITCDVYEPMDGKPYDRDPRSIAKKAEAYLKSTGLGDVAYFGPEPEFFIFDGVTWDVDMSGCFVKIKSEEAPWSSGIDYESGNMGHRAPVKGGYFPVPPTDTLRRHPQRDGARARAAGRRSAKCTTTRSARWASTRSARASRRSCSAPTGCRSSSTRCGTPPRPTARPRPSCRSRSSATTARACTCHQSVWKGGKNLFAGNGYAGLSDFALHYIGGIIKHAKALNAITNPGTNSYKRLVPGFEAPINLAYSARNRSAACRIPYVSSPNGRRVEVRFPDPTANAYLAFAAMLMAGLDGVQNKIHPGDPIDKDLYHLPPEEAAKVPHVCASLEEALDCLQRRPRVPHARRRVLRRLARLLHRAQERGAHALPHDHAPGRVRHVLLRVIAAVCTAIRGRCEVSC